MSDTFKFFNDVKRHPERFLIVHYSSQSLYDDEEVGLSPRITSIVVIRFANDQSISFASHAIAEELGIARDGVPARFDEIEKELLIRFYNFVRDHRGHTWVHWNMRNLVYGFEHLEHRFRKLTGLDPPAIPVESRVNLSDMVRERYGKDYAAHPRMLNLMLMNEAKDPRFLTGDEESEAFANKDYIRMYSSTVSKVEFFKRVLRLSLRGKLKTSGHSWGERLDHLFESRTSKLISLLSAALGLAVILWQALRWLAPVDVGL